MGPLEPLLYVEFWLCRVSSRDSRLDLGEEGTVLGLGDCRAARSSCSSGGGVFFDFLENFGRKFIEVERRHKKQFGRDEARLGTVVRQSRSPNFFFVRSVGIR